MRHGNRVLLAMKMKDRQIWLLKSIAIVGVVSHHLANRRFLVETQAILGIVPQIMSWCVMAFILCSGYLQSVSVQRSSENAISHIFLRKRLLRLSLVFVSIAAVYSLAYETLLSLGAIPDSPDISHGNFLSRIFGRWCATITGIGSGVGEQLYYFPLLISTMLVAYPFWRFVPSAAIGPGVAAVVVGAVIASCIGIQIPRTVFTVSIYLAGFALHQQRRSSGKWFICATVVAVIAEALWTGMGMQVMLPVVILAGLIKIDAHCRWLERIGEASGTVFLYHTPFLLTPLLVVCARLQEPLTQVVAAYVTACVVISLLVGLHFWLKGHKLGWLTLG